MASAANASDFGDLTQARQNVGGCANSTRAVFAGGHASGVGDVNIIDYVVIASTGNASDFGDLLAAKQGGVGLSGGT